MIRLFLGRTGISGFRILLAVKKSFGKFVRGRKYGSRHKSVESAFRCEALRLEPQVRAEKTISYKWLGDTKEGFSEEKGEIEGDGVVSREGISVLREEKT